MLVSVSNSRSPCDCLKSSSYRPKSVSQNVCRAMLRSFISFCPTAFGKLLLFNSSQSRILLYHAEEIIGLEKFLV
jgi:hypothetical protein